MIFSMLTLFFLGFAHPVATTPFVADFYFVIRGEFAWNPARMGRVFEMQGVEHSLLLQ